MTPQEILELSEPVEQVYTDVVAQLVSNICRHLGQGKELSTQQWEIKKLSELDALTNESIKIIQNASGKSRAEIKRAIAEAMGVGVRDVEKVLKGAERAGAIAGIGFTAEQSDALKNLLSNLVNQAEDRANLVNTVMLNSTRNRYVWAVNNTATEEQKLIEKLLSARNAEELERQLGKVQTALNVATSSVEVGSESRVQALSRTVKQLAQEGITGYIDAGGHHWSPEAYMNMDIRTTVHNAYVQAQKERAAEHGVSTFQITSHAGARPGCVDFQGKFYSWDGSDGVLEDLHGNKHVYESIYSTTYGQPAGIFGINCGHDPVTFVNGYSIPRYEPTQDTEQNAKEYAESQKQRQLERNVRQAKLEAIAQDAAGNKEAFKTAAEKVRQANADYKAYCKETGRTPRNDRLQVYASPDGQGYNRSMSGKVTGTTKGWKPPTTPTTPANVASQATTATSQTATVQAKEKTPTERLMELGFRSVQTTGMNEDQLKDTVTRLTELEDKFHAAKDGDYSFRAYNKGEDEEAIAFVRTNWGSLERSLNVNNEYFGTPVEDMAKLSKRMTDLKWSMPCAEDQYKFYSVTHEYGHMVQNGAILKRMDADELNAYIDRYSTSFKNVWRRDPTAEELEAATRSWRYRQVTEQKKAIKQELMGYAKLIDKKATIKRDMSDYGKSKDGEFFAEAFANAFCGEPNAYGKAMLKWLEKEGLL